MESSFFAPYKEMLDCAARKKRKWDGGGDKSLPDIEECCKYLDKSLKDIYDEYKAFYVKEAEGTKEEGIEGDTKKDGEKKHDSWRSWQKVDERLSDKDKEYYAVLEAVLLNPEIANESELRWIEEFLFKVMNKIHRIFDVLKGCSISELHYRNSKDDEECMEIDLAVIFFLEFTFSKRHFHSSATMDRFSRMAGNYEKDIDRCKKIFSKIEVYGEDALGLMKKKARDEKTVWYCDIPYSETDVSTYAASWFDEKGFVENLSKCAGDYIVASRFNIPEKERKRVKSLPAGAKQEELDDAYKQKELNIIKFFSRFVTEGFADRYKDLVEKESDELKTKKANNDWNHISNEKKAKYIVFAFTLTGQNDEGYFKRTASLSQDAVRMMLKDTQIGNVPVEIMLTNMDIDINRMPVHKVKGGEGMWYMPGFKTASAYMVEPVTIIMEYENFMEKMVLGLLRKDLYETMTAREYAAAYHNFFQEL